PDENTRQRLLQYIPTDALVVVIGFSGWERRIVSLLGELAKRPDAIASTTRILWLQLEPTAQVSKENATSFLDLLRLELSDRGSTALRCRQISGAATFLPGLYFKLANCFPGGRATYSAGNA